MRSPVSNGLEVGTMYTNDRRARELLGYIAEDIRQNQSEQSQIFSDMSDSSSDRSLTENELK